ncbi:MAG TPA: bifunctional phosphoribosylaminoimidazolecarboxamide formyltransferase/IMP cyclohydrolase [Candidatus Limnocylindrales bacterium]|nr:bifunctional phosphoribosylaminoimidazolecarboxamide formyltransferase/IMP cyclohydrolase [Candidatus Limnocylindrales bacterium]
MRALLSVADGTGIADLARELLDLGIEVIAADGTREVLAEAGLETTPLSDLTGLGDLMAGPVKTYHPAVYAGILARRHVPEDMAILTEQGMGALDIVVVGIRPFAPQVGRRLVAIDEAVEMMDVAGLSLLGAAARNFGGVTVVCDPSDHGALVAELREQGHVSAEMRRRLAAKAFGAVAAYQGEVAAYLDHIGGLRFPEQLSVVLRKERDLPYGENPHQGAAFYRETTHRSRSLADAEHVQGPPPTFNDLIDLDAGYRMAVDFASPTCAIVKQRNPVGLASHDDPREAYRRALSGDPVTAYGAVVAFNRELDEGMARELVLNPFEGVAASGYSEGARALLAGRPELAVLAVPPPPADGLSDYGIAELDFHRIAGGLLVETRDTLEIDHAQLHVVTTRRPTLEELTDLMFAWRAVRHITSLAVVVAKGATLVGVGAGQSSRLTATEIALHRAADRAPRSVLASDAYFPFGDAIALAAERGVTAIIQPGGSARDEMAIEIADRHHLAMVFTGRRHFRH